MACGRFKRDSCGPGPDRVLEPALHHLASDPDPHVRAMAAELVGKLADSEARAVAALQASRTRAVCAIGPSEAVTPTGFVM
ncbi:HEAT repeat domain-containing protein [Streptomyces viridochromogenes]